MTTRLKYSLGGILMVASASAFAQTAPPAANGLPDAQVESNVLRALAGASDLSTQNIQTNTVYGTVTISGNVHDEAMRTKAENLVARTQGVKKVVDQLTLGDTPPPTNSADNAPQGDPNQGNAPQGQSGQVLLSDGTYGPPPSGDQNGQPMPPDQQLPADQQPQGQHAPPPPGYNDQQGYPQQGPPQGPPQGRQPLYANGAPYQPPPGATAGQRPGIPVVVPPNSPLRIRINRGLTSQQTQPGTPFDGTVMGDVVANGVVAIPRGATVQGTVIDAKKAGVFKGHGEIALQVTSLTLGGQVYPVNTQVWVNDGHDKTAGTVNRTAGTAAFGAIIGALAGGGEGAAIGAGVGAGAGLASSAGGPRGQVMIPPESVLTFVTAAPTPVRTVSEQEMQRLSFAAGPGPQPQRPMRRYYSPYYGYYYGPAY
ncbi:BON domain-containing protein [Granulicella paludicola]|uniref:BON domain-containing protein n=1 Tax=Granulicella paludicola TaxID=474951 RepID=UPI0021E0CAB2|nr:BON domain-containing protein [Granulicella paludicola]